MPTGPTTARSSSGSPPGRPTGGSPGSTRSSSGSASASRPTNTPRTTSATSRSGRAPKPGEPSWSTAIGDGRPGWHIECSAMSMAPLGPSFDFHTGGIDLIFPHHEDEIAQSEAATGQPFVGTWLHCAHLQMGGSKMAKSTGNIARVGDLLAAGVSPAGAALCAAVRPLSGEPQLLRRLARRRRPRRSNGSTRSWRLARLSRGRADAPTLPAVLAGARDGLRGGARRRPQHLGRAGRRVRPGAGRSTGGSSARALSTDAMPGRWPSWRTSTRSSGCCRPPMPRCPPSSGAPRRPDHGACRARLGGLRSTPGRAHGARGRGRGHARRPALAPGR